MIQRRKGLDAVRQQLIQQPVVEIEALWLWCAGSLREDTRPGNRKTIGLCAQCLHQLNVFPVKMIMVGRGVGVAVIGDRPMRMGLAIKGRSKKNPRWFPAGGSLGSSLNNRDQKLR